MEIPSKFLHILFLNKVFTQSMTITQHIFIIYSIDLTDMVQSLHNLFDTKLTLNCRLTIYIYNLNNNLFVQ